MAKIAVTRDGNSIKIMCNDTLHANFVMDNYCGMQSWIEPMDTWQHKVEFTFSEGAVILLEYDTKEKWQALLIGLDNVLK